MKVSCFLPSDGICNRPKDNPDDRAAATAQRLVDDFGVKIIKVAVGNVDCAEVNGAIPLGPCYESSNPKDLNLNDIVGTKLINGTIEIDNNVQGTTFPATVPEFTAGLKQQDFDWTGNLGPGTYDVYATTFGQNANSYLPQSVTDEEIALFSVVDQTPPQISCPGNIEVASTKASCQEVVTYSIQSDDNCPSSTLVQTAVSVQNLSGVPSLNQSLTHSVSFAANRGIQVVPHLTKAQQAILSKSQTRVGTLLHAALMLPFLVHPLPPRLHLPQAAQLPVQQQVLLRFPQQAPLLHHQAAQLHFQPPAQLAHQPQAQLQPLQPFKRLRLNLQQAVQQLPQPVHMEGQLVPIPFKLQ
mmetsp:Transcript_29913/g.69704  ORF Transcript_29913/g.69704 Transcript_29913/m.69704 type:complete len:355 (+) Transcript_29913:258-1322(+)